MKLCFEEWILFSLIALYIVALWIDPRQGYWLIPIGLIIVIKFLAYGSNEDKP